MSSISFPKRVISHQSKLKLRTQLTQTPNASQVCIYVKYLGSEKNKREPRRK